MAYVRSFLVSIALHAALLGSTRAALLPEVKPRQAAPPLPQYVIDNAPLVKMTSGEPFQPADIAAQLANTHPTINTTAIDASAFPAPLTLSNLDALNNVANSRGGQDVYLASNVDFTTQPSPQYLLGITPDGTGTTQPGVGTGSPTSSGPNPSDTCLEERQSSPQTQQQASCVIIVNDHRDGTVDAFYFYFYAYDNGPMIAFDNFNSFPLGSHVGDWEHNMIRFTNGAPSAIWYSQHANGEAFEWDAAGLPKQDGRPISYCANGTHANYATAGTHFYPIPNVPLETGPIEDHTDDAGVLWDPTKAAFHYTVTVPGDTKANADGTVSNPPVFTAAGSGVGAGSAPVAWLNYRGKFGDPQLEESDSRQHMFLGAAAEYVGGPTGPWDKQLRRTNVCPGDGFCWVRPFVPDGG